VLDEAVIKAFEIAKGKSDSLPLYLAAFHYIDKARYGHQVLCLHARLPGRSIPLRWIKSPSGGAPRRSLAPGIASSLINHYPRLNP
jgi:hypothetical protein